MYDCLTSIDLMKLADLPLEMPARSALRGADRSAASTSDSRNGKAGRSVCRGARYQGGRPALRARCTRRRRRRRRWRERSPALSRRCRLHRKSTMRAARSRLPPRHFSAPAGDHRRGHRHQRQDFGRRFHAADLEALGLQAASIGTIGVVSPRGETYGSLTTPDPVGLHRTLDVLAGEGVTHLAIEASSHGLDQHRLDGVRIAAAPSPTYRAIISIIIRPSKRILPPSCGCSSDAARAERRRSDRCRRLSTQGRWSMPRADAASG